MSQAHQKVREFYQRDATVYQREHWFRNAVSLSDYELTKKLLLQCVRPQQSDIVLEIGCGPGTWTKVIAPTVSYLVAMDLAPNMIAQATSYVRASNVRFLCGDVSTDLPQQKFDKIYSVRMFEYVEDKTHLLQQLASRLNPGGSLTIVTKTTPSVWRGRSRVRRLLSRLIPSWDHSDFHKDYGAFFWQQLDSPWALRRKMLGVGLTRGAVYPISIRPPIFAGGKLEYPLISDARASKYLQFFARASENVHAWPAPVRLALTILSEAYIITAIKRD